jgi:hypothetical protein
MWRRVFFGKVTGSYSEDGYPGKLGARARL